MQTVTLAVKTLKAIDDAIAADQGATFRQHLQKVLPHIGDAYRGVEKNPFRNHLGASVIGNECARAIWFGFRWFLKPKFEGRILRLFNRGHMEEARFIACLLTAGVQIYQQDENGRQFRISDFGGHFGGSGDGVAIGIPDLLPGTPCLTEFKTHNDKSFQGLVKEGVRRAKYEHYTQANIYMKKMGLQVCLYGAVNKNDDKLYLELLYLDTTTTDQMMGRAGQIIFMRTPPKRISESPGWFGCRFCDHKPHCHGTAPVERNCRTCVYSDPSENGNWYCMNSPRCDAEKLTEDMQLAACERYNQIK